MTSWKTRNYKRIFSGDIWLEPDEGIAATNHEITVAISAYQIGQLRGKTAYIPDSVTTDNVGKIIIGRCRYYYYSGFGDIYVSPACTFSRDVLRNSGYKIKLDPEKARVTVIDEPPKPLRYNYNLIAYREDAEDLIIFDLQNQSEIKINEEIANEIIAAVKAEIELKLGDGAISTYFVDNLARTQVQFLPKCVEWEDMIYGYPSFLPKRDYVLVDRLKITPSVEVTLDNLIVWMSCDRDVLEKTLIQCNWKEYPMTLAVILASEYDKIAYSSSRAVKSMLAKIGFYGYTESKTFPDVDVDKKDWDMLQSYILHKLGLKENGGFVNTEKWKNLPDDYKRFILSKMAVAPLKTNSAMMFDNYINTIENSKKEY